MSHDALNEFVSKLNTDEALRTALQERFTNLSDIPADDLIAFAGEQGYGFSVEEAEAELSEDVLEGVAGGLSGTVIPKLEIDQTATAGHNFEEIKVTYVPLSRSFSLIRF